MGPRKSAQLAPPPVAPGTLRRSTRQASRTPEPEEPQGHDTPAPRRSRAAAQTPQDLPMVKVEPPTPGDVEHDDADAGSAGIARRTRSRSTTPQPEDLSAPTPRRSTRARSTTPQPEDIDQASSKPPAKTPTRRGRKAVAEEAESDEQRTRSPSPPKSTATPARRGRGKAAETSEDIVDEAPKKGRTPKAKPAKEPSPEAEPEDIEFRPPSPKPVKTPRSTRKGASKAAEEKDEQVAKKTPAKRGRKAKSPSPEAEDEEIEIQPEPVPLKDESEEHQDLSANEMAENNVEPSADEESEALDEEIEVMASADEVEASADDAEMDVDEMHAKMDIRILDEGSDSDSDSDAAPEETSTSAAKAALLSAEKQRRAVLAATAEKEKQKRIEREEKRKAEREEKKAREAEEAKKAAVIDKEESSDDEDDQPAGPKSLEEAARLLFASDSEESDSESGKMTLAPPKNKRNVAFGPDDSEASELESLADFEPEPAEPGSRQVKGMLDLFVGGAAFDKLIEEEKAKSEKKKKAKRKLTPEEKEAAAKKRRIEEIEERGGKILGCVWKGVDGCCETLSLTLRRPLTARLPLCRSRTAQIPAATCPLLLLNQPWTSLPEDYTVARSLAVMRLRASRSGRSRRVDRRRRRCSRRASPASQPLRGTPGLQPVAISKRIAVIECFE